MPALDARSLLVLIEDTRRSSCLRCPSGIRENLRKNYCRTCDEFYHSGHESDCISQQPDSDNVDNHVGHRTYDLDALAQELQEAKLDFLDRRIGEISLGLPSPRARVAAEPKFRVADEGEVVGRRPRFDADGVDC